MEVIVPVFDEAERSPVGSTILEVADVPDPVDGIRRISIPDRRLQGLGGQVMSQGVSYAGETNLSVVIPGTETPDAQTVVDWLA